MRQGIYKDEDGIRNVDIQKALGKCYNNGWFTNTTNCRYRLFKGSRNSKKSYNIIGNECVLRMISDDITNILVVRKNDVDNRNSTFTNIQRAINDFGLENEFAINKTNMEITHISSGRKIIFKGLNNPTSLTSIQPAVGHWNAVYIEEAFEIDSFDDFKKLDYSIRSAGMEYDKNGNLVEAHYSQQITMTFNAWSSEHWLYTEFFKKAGFEDDVEYLETHKYADYKDENFIGPYGTGVYLHISTYKANEFRDRNQVDVAAQAMRVASYDEYCTLFLGCWGNATETTYPEFKADNVIPEEKLQDFTFSNFAIGIDTGMSAGDGSKPKVLKGQDVGARVKAANTMCLGAITPGFDKIVAIDEYFHSNNSHYAEFNTDGAGDLNINDQVSAILLKICEWIDKYGEGRRSIRNDMLMKGTINVYIDSADIGFRQLLELGSKNIRLSNGMLLSSRVRFMGATKTKIWDRVQFERVMFGFKDMLVCQNCKNLIRELKNSRKGEKGEARTDGNDHLINAYEYFYAPFRNSFVKWKLFDKSE